MKGCAGPAELMAQQNVVPTGGEVIRHHLDLLVRASAGTVRTHQTMLNLQGMLSADNQCACSASATLELETAPWERVIPLAFGSEDSPDHCRGPDH